MYLYQHEITARPSMLLITESNVNPSCAEDLFALRRYWPCSIKIGKYQKKITAALCALIGREKNEAGPS